jgi:hypothetical protein
MNFEDESYVRLYTRDTSTWLRLGFEGQAVLVFLIRKLDRSGVLDGIEEPATDVALVTGVPLAIVEVGLPRLLERGVLTLRGTQLVMPNYVQAQNARQSDRVRKLESRARRAAGVTFRDEESPTVTSGPPASPTVTPILADPILAQPSSADPDRAPEAPPVPGLIRVVSDSGVRTLTMPSETPPKAYLDLALMAAVSREQAISTWKHYWGAGLPRGGVEKLHPWLCERAKDRANQLARASPGIVASLRQHGSKQGNAGFTGFESLEGKEA